MSEFWKRKVRTYFHRLDFDNDGVIWKRDFERMAEGFSATEIYDPVRKEKLRKSWAVLWLKFTGSTQTGEKEYLTEAMLIDNLNKQRNDPKLKTSIQDVSRSFWEPMYTNEDGYIKLQEFARGFESTGVPDTRFAEQAFKAIDTNHDGKLSFDEIIHAMVEFFLSEDEDSSCNLCWGPLI